MEESRKHFNWNIFWVTLLNPIMIILYGWAWRRFALLCQYGGLKRNMMMIAATGALMLVILAVSVFRGLKSDSSMGKRGRLCIGMTLVGCAAITLYYGASVYHSAQNLNGKLAWYLYERSNKKEIILEHDNVYIDGVQGFLEDLGQELDLPEELYLSSGFNMHFMADGCVESLDTFIYGWDEYGNQRSYLISYNRKNSDNMTVYLDGETTGTREEEKRLEPLFTVLEQISVKDTVDQWQEGEYGILYYGVRRWGGNPEGIIYVDSQGNTAPASLGPSEISGYTVSVFVPGKESEITPVRYLLVDHVMEPEFEQWETQEPETEPDYNTDEEFHLSETEYYRLNVVDAALGSRYYALEKSEDGGKNWNRLNPDPFLGQGGVAAGIVFLDSDLGFMALSHNGGDNAELYRTGDGGASMELVEFVHPKMEESDIGEPFDFPGMPYEEDGVLKVQVGQGADGDYQGGRAAIYQSLNKGMTWELVE